MRGGLPPDQVRGNPPYDLTGSKCNHSSIEYSFPTFVHLDEGGVFVITVCIEHHAPNAGETE